MSRTRRSGRLSSPEPAAAIPGTWPSATNSTGRRPRRRCCPHLRRADDRLTVNPANHAKLDQRITAAAASALTARQFVTPVEVLTGIGWLNPADVERWRRGRVPYLERAATANLAQLSTALRLLRGWAHRNGLIPSETAYVAWARDHHRLCFTRTGDVNLERAYRTH